MLAVQSNADVSAGAEARLAKKLGAVERELAEARGHIAKLSSQVLKTRSRCASLAQALDDGAPSEASKEKSEAMEVEIAGLRRQIADYAAHHNPHQRIKIVQRLKEEVTILQQANVALKEEKRQLEKLALAFQ